MILLVEDHEDNRSLIRQLVTDWLGLQLVEAEDGQQGVRLARELRPSLVLMDLSLPVLDGWTAAKLLKADPLTAHIPIIALSAHAMSGDEEKAFLAGCDAYMSKPIDLSTLADLIVSFRDEVMP